MQDREFVRRCAANTVDWMIDHEKGACHPLVWVNRPSLRAMLEPWLIPGRETRLREIDAAERAQIEDIVFGFIWAQIYRDSPLGPEDN